MKTALEAGLVRHDEKPYVDESILLSETDLSEERFIPLNHNAEGKVRYGMLRYIANQPKKGFVIIHRRKEG